MTAVAPPGPRHAQAPADGRAATAPGTPPPQWIRGAVRDVLEAAPGYQSLDADNRRSLANAMVRVSSLAARLIDEEGDTHAAGTPARAPLARAQAQPEFGAAAERIAPTVQNVLNAVSFPRFVTELINGVFRAMLDSNQAQMQQYVNLLNAVSASADGFEGAQFGLMRVRQWLADQFPEAIEYDAPEIEPGETPDPAEVANTRLRLRSGASMPSAAIVRATLGMAPEDPLDASTPEQLLPFARRFLARQRQQMLATMVTMGMQRIVIDSGKINAAMRLRIDTRSAANEDRGSQTSVQNRIKGGGSFGFGPWGASAEVENTISYVSTQRSQSTEEINTDLGLDSSVELNFRSDYLPLNQMANQAQADRIRNSTLNPAAAAPDDSATARTARQAAQRAAEDARRAATPIAMPAPAAPSPVPTPPPAPARPAPSPAAGNPPAVPAPGASPAPGAPAAPARSPATTAPPANAPVTAPSSAPATATPPATPPPPAPAPASAAAPAAPATPPATTPGSGNPAAPSSTPTIGSAIGAAAGGGLGNALAGIVGAGLGGAAGG